MSRGSRGRHLLQAELRSRQPLDELRLFTQDATGIARGSRAVSGHCDGFDALARRDRVLRANLAQRAHRFAHELELDGDGPIGVRARGRPLSEGQMFARLSPRQPLPERLGHERHDRVQQPQRVVEHVHEHRARDLAVLAPASRGAP